MVGFYQGLSERLSLYVRQIAWLNTAPDPPKNAKGQGKPPVRIKRMKADGIPVELPDNPSPYLVDWLMEIGPLSTGGMGPACLSWTDIRDWERLTGNQLDPWEARTLRRLSRDFVDQMNKAKEANCPAPYSSGTVNTSAVDAQFAAMFKAMSRKKTTR